MPIKTINGEPFNIVVEGKADGPVLLFSNSLSSNLSMWDPQAEALKANFRIIRYDSRGHGKSVAGSGPYSIAQLGRDALAILDALKVEKAHFCGLSKGGMVGQWLLTHHRDRIGKAVLANTAAQMPPPALWNGRIRNVSANGMAAIVDATIERWFTKDFISRAPNEIATVKKMIATTPAAGYCGCCAAIRDMDQRDSIRSITNPVLLISGARDPATSPTMMELMKDRIKGARWVSLDAAAYLQYRTSYGIYKGHEGLPRMSTDADRLANGTRNRRKVLGDAHVDRSLKGRTEFNGEWVDYITRTAWGDIWDRPGLDWQKRSVVVLSVATALGRWEEFRIHVKGAINNGLTRDEIKEVLMQCAVYAGVPAANTAFHEAQKVFDEMDSVKA